MLRNQKRLLTQALLAMAAFLTPAPSDAAGPTGNWNIDPAHTEIAFSIDAVGYPKTQGEFRQFDGRISINLDRPEKSSVAFHVKTGSVDVGSSSFSDYLRSEAFLDAARHPSIDFVSTSVAKISERVVRVSGELTLLGVTKPLSVDVTVTPLSAGRRFAFHADAEIDRLAFGMNSGFPLVSREVELRISSEAAAL